jgi:tyrosyl-tRNA synthetase
MSTSITPSTATPANPVFIEQAQALCRGGEFLPGGVDMLAKKLQTAAENQCPLNIKLGLDPTRPDLHLGHTVVLKKLRAFQDLGHQAILIIGDATAMIGDPSGRSVTRPPLTEAEVQKNAKTYLDQADKIIDTRKAKILRNSEWLSGINLDGFLKLAAKVTVAQIIAREDFSNRLKENQPISLHELFYPLMQGYDSVVVNADIELGGTDQRFNNLMGRELQQAYETPHLQMVLLMPLMEGTDGKVKMSKSYPENCINLTDTPGDMYGKLMSIPDPLIPRYELLLGLLNEMQIKEQAEQIKQGNLNPRDLKMMIAKYIVQTYHSSEAAEQAEKTFVTVFQKRDVPEEMDSLNLSLNTPYPLLNLVTENGMSPSRNETRRLISGGGVKLNGEKVISPDLQLHYTEPATLVLQVGKRKFLRLCFQ